MNATSIKWAVLESQSRVEGGGGHTLKIPFFGYAPARLHVRIASVENNYRTLLVSLLLSLLVYRRFQCKGNPVTATTEQHCKLLHQHSAVAVYYIRWQSLSVIPLACRIITLLTPSPLYSIHLPAYIQYKVNTPSVVDILYCFMGVIIEQLFSR